MEFYPFKRFLFRFFWFLALVAACGQPPKPPARELPKEIAATFVRTGNPVKTGTGRVLELNMTTVAPDGAVLFQSTSMRRGFRVFLDGTSPYNAGQFYDALLQIGRGDSIQLRIPAANLYDSTLKKPLPEGVAPADSLVLSIGVVLDETLDGYILRKETAFEARKLALSTSQDSMTVADGNRIDAFLTQKSAVFEQTPAGIRYMMEHTGSGKAPAPGERVTVHYRGTLLDGTLFDASYDRSEPFSFRYGIGDVIFGFDEGVGLLNEGGKVTVIIPSPLAYGSQNRSEVIKAHSILVFEIELLRVDGK